MKWDSFLFLSWHSTSNVDQQLCQSASSWLDMKGILSPSSDNNQLVMLINNCVNQPCLHSIQRGHLSPSSCNKQLVMSINNLCQLTLSPLNMKGLLSPSSDNSQLVISINNCVDRPCLCSIWRAYLSPSSSINNQPVMSINNCVKHPLLDSIWIHSPSSCNNQPVLSSQLNTKGVLSPSSPLATINQFYQSTIVSNDLFSTQYKGDPFSFFWQQSTGHVDQQWCQLILSPLNMKGTPFSFILYQQSTRTNSINDCVGQVLCYSIHQQLFHLLSSPLATINNNNDNHTDPAHQEISMHCSAHFLTSLW